MPNGAKSTAFAAIGSVVVESSIAIVSWGWEAKGRRLGVGGEGSVVEERGRGEGKREGKSEREAESAEGWGSELDRQRQRAGWGGYEWESEGKRGTGEKAKK